MSTYKVDGTINGQQAEFSVTTTGNYRDGSKDIACEIITDTDDIYEDLDEVSDPEDIIQWAERHGFAWNDEANTDDIRRGVLLNVIAMELGFEN